jgi:alanyl-tRNA synthetase
MQGVQTNYHIDILQPIVDAAAEVCGRKYVFESDDGRRLRRITDHIRACSMAIHENVYPGPQKEKYVIRRLLRRAVLDGHQMGLSDPFLYKIVPAVVETMKSAYPELEETTQRVADVVKNEEANFFGTIDAGLAHVERIFSDMKRDNRTKVDGAEAADLYQTYGVPPEVFESMAAENNLAFDWDGYVRAMEQHGVDSGRAAHTVMGDKGPVDAIKRALHETPFLGYETTEAEAELKFAIAQDQLCDHIREVGQTQNLTLVLDRTPFYGESGGQVGDTGVIEGPEFRFRVTDTQRDGSLILHLGHLEQGELRTGQAVTARVESSRRRGIGRAHSATHILHFALQKTLGTHARQQGSKVEDDWLRFDFTSMTPVSSDQLEQVEHDANQRIAEAAPIAARIIPLADARAAGAMMLFGEKYPDPVRMVSMGDFSHELCGGTHLKSTDEVGPLEIISEEGVSAGVRRIVALTGEKAKQHAERTRETLREAAEQLGVPLAETPRAVRDLARSVRDLKKQLAAGGKSSEAAADSEAQVAASGSPDYATIKASLRETARMLNVAAFDVPKRLASLLAEKQDLERQLEQLAEAGDLSAESLLEKAETIGETQVVVVELPGANPNLMRQLIDQLRKKGDSTAILLAAVTGETKVLLVAGVSRDLVERGCSAGDWVRRVAPVVGGGGGGKPDMAQAGGKLPDKLPEALELARTSIREMLDS